MMTHNTPFKSPVIQAKIPILQRKGPNQIIGSITKATLFKIHGRAGVLMLFLSDSR